MPTRRAPPTVSELAERPKGRDGLRKYSSPFESFGSIAKKPKNKPEVSLGVRPILTRCDFVLNLDCHRYADTALHSDSTPWLPGELPKLSSATPRFT